MPSSPNTMLKRMEVNCGLSSVKSRDVIRELLIRCSKLTLAAMVDVVFMAVSLTSVQSTDL